MKYSKIVLVCVVAVVLLLLCVDIVPPYNYSLTVIHGIAVRIEKYYDVNKKLPDNLSELPLREGYDNSLVDYWGGPIIYEYDSELNVKLTSLGKDGKAGGDGDKTDIVCEFKVPLTYPIQ